MRATGGCLIGWWTETLTAVTAIQKLQDRCWVVNTTEEWFCTLKIYSLFQTCTSHPQENRWFPIRSSFSRNTPHFQVPQRSVFGGCFFVRKMPRCPGRAARLRTTLEGSSQQLVVFQDWVVVVNWVETCADPRVVRGVREDQEKGRCCWKVIRIFMVSLEKNCHEFQAPTNHWLIRQWVFLKNGAHLAGPRFAIIYIYI